LFTYIILCNTDVIVTLKATWQIVSTSRGL